MGRREVIGAIIFVSGVMLFGLVHLAIAIYVPDMGGWSDPPGKFNQARDEIMVDFPYFLSLIFTFVGLILMFYKDLREVYIKLFVDDE